MLKIPHTGVFASVLALWHWRCSIFSHCCSIDIRKKLVPLRLGLILFKPWVFASRIVSCFREKEDYNQNYSSIWSNTLGSVGEKAVPPLPSTSGTPHKYSSGQGIMWARNFQLLMHSPFLWPLFSNSIKRVWLQAVLEVTDSPDSANYFLKSWHCQEEENSSPKSHNLMGSWSYMRVSQSNHKSTFLKVFLGQDWACCQLQNSFGLCGHDLTQHVSHPLQRSLMWWSQESQTGCLERMVWPLPPVLSWFTEHEKNVLPTYQHLGGMVGTSQHNLVVSVGEESTCPVIAHAPSSPWVRRVSPSACQLWTTSNPHESQYLTWVSQCHGAWWS